MINTDAFTKRLQIIIDYYGETASSFAEKIGVQRSSISHILSGRNKPSLEFVLKIFTTYPEVELYWLLNGKGEFPNVIKANHVKPITSAQSPTLFSEHDQKEEQKHLPPTLVNSNEKSIERIVIFYSDGSFKNFQNS